MQQWSVSQLLLESIPGISNIYNFFVGGGSVQLLDHGDSGGPLYDGQKLCGVNSSFRAWPHCDLCTCIPDLDPNCTCIPGTVKCNLYVENEQTRIDTVDARDFLIGRLQSNKPERLLVDSKGNWIGTCGGEGPASKQDIDTDGDLIPDACDPCPTVYDAQYHDTGVYTDYTDTDGDGIPDICDNCPDTGTHEPVGPSDPGRELNGNRWAQPDSDSDGIGNACDTCPHSDLRAVAGSANSFQSDWVCCNNNADCSGTPGSGYHTSHCVPLPNPNEPISITNPQVGFAPNECAGHAGRCSFGKDADVDGTSDQCDNCPDDTATQDDADGDGVGDDCDNCPGTGDATGEYPDPQHHEADRNDYVPPTDPATNYTPPDMVCAPDGVPDPAGEAYCKGLNSEGRCVPGKVVGGVLQPALCSKFPDADGDSVGDACDNCRITSNHDPNGPGSNLGDLNGQANCNLLAEVAGGMAYPYLGDACDPSPCNRVARHPAGPAGGLYPYDWTDDGKHGDLWGITTYDPQILPDSKTPDFRSPETPFNSTYTQGQTPVATVGARVCDCGLDPDTHEARNAWQCHLLNICRIDPSLYDKQPYRVLQTFGATAPDLASLPTPDSSNLAPNGEVSNLPLEAAAGTTPITAGPNNDHLAPFLGAPTYVAWDLTASGAANHGAVLGYGLLGVYWTAVRDVPQVLPGTPAGTTKPFTDWSNKYSSGFAGQPGPLSSASLTKSTCPLCNLGTCPYCQIRICKACLVSPEFNSLVTSPATGQVFAQTSSGPIDITSEFSSGALEAVSATGTRWVPSAERGGWIGANGLAFSVLSTDGTTVEATLVAGSEGVTLLGAGGIINPFHASATPVATSSSPPPRSDFGAVLSGHENALFVIGGTLADGTPAGDLWMYDFQTMAWYQLPFTGPVPRKVLAATYLPDTRSLWLVDQTGQHPKRARLLRYDFATGAFVRLGSWRRTPVFDAWSSPDPPRATCCSAAAPSSPTMSRGSCSSPAPRRSGSSARSSGKACSPSSPRSVKRR